MVSFLHAAARKRADPKHADVYKFFSCECSAYVGGCFGLLLLTYILPLHDRGPTGNIISTLQQRRRLSKHVSHVDRILNQFMT